MHINELPYEILSSILQQAASTNGQEGVKFTYGLGSNPLPLQSSKLSRYVRGPISPDVLRWDAACAVRQVCSQWHEWALDYAIKDVHLSRWRGAERWAELSTRRKMYNIYELIERPSGARVYRDPFGTLRQTASILARFPDISKHLRRLWFSGFYTPETDRLIFDTLRSCRNLTSISIPWTLLRHGSADDWMHLLGIAGPSDSPLESLEIQAVCLMESQTSDTDFQQDLQPLRDPRISFQYLKRLKLFGNTTMMPVNDEDLTLIAGTIASLEEFHVTCLSTVSIEGVMAIVKASQSTLRVLEHAPRSHDGFYHPDPGTLKSGEHICSILTSCPILRDVSISIPSMCADLFSNLNVRWEGDCQVRALGLCGDENESRLANLRRLLDQARSLIASKTLERRHLDIELFFAECIFDPRDCVVHGDFALAEICSSRTWPSTKTESSKGPYGTTGLYGKDEGNWEIVSEEEYLRAVEKGWITI